MLIFVVLLLYWPWLCCTSLTYFSSANTFCAGGNTLGNGTVLISGGNKAVTYGGECTTFYFMHLVSAFAKAFQDVTLILFILTWIHDDDDSSQAEMVYLVQLHMRIITEEQHFVSLILARMNLANIQLLLNLLCNLNVGTLLLRHYKMVPSLLWVLSKKEVAKAESISSPHCFSKCFCRLVEWEMVVMSILNMQITRLLNISLRKEIKSVWTF